MYLAATNSKRGTQRKKRASQQLVEESEKHKNNIISHGSLRKKIKRRNQKELSLFEQLPKEILQEILFLSRNCSLPLASRHLALCLTSRTIFLTFSMNVLHVEKGGANPCPDSQYRLFSCRFFTFEFFKLYINWAYDLHIKNRKADDMEIEPRPNLNGMCFMPLHLRPYLQLSLEILIPEKLFHEVWKDGKMYFLRLIFRLSGQRLTAQLSKRPLQRDSALQGLKLAIENNESGPFFALHPWLRNDFAAWEDLLEHLLTIANVSQSMLATVLDFSCFSGCCARLHIYYWELALGATNNGGVGNPELLCAIENHEAKHEGDFAKLHFSVSQIDISVVY